MARLVCILSPFRESATRSRERHRQFAILLCRAAADASAIPFASHLYGPIFLDEDVPDDRAMGLRISKTVIARCDEVWVWDLWGISAGMKAEIDHAVECNKIATLVGVPKIEIRYMSKNAIPEWEHLREAA